MNQCLAIDVGTLSVRAMLIDASLRIHAEARCPLQLIHHNPQEIELDATQLLDAVNTVITEITTRHPRIHAAGLACQRSTIVAWDRRSGQPLAPALSWQDTRAAPLLKNVHPYASDIQQRSGLVLTAHYGAAKIAWLLQHNPAIANAQQQGHLCVGPLASFLLYHLTQNPQCQTDESNAARMQLWNIHTRQWDTTLIHYFQIPPDILPTVKPVSHFYGTLRNTRIPLQISCGDQSAAIAGAGQLPANSLLINIGTGAFILLPTGTTARHCPGLLTGIQYSDSQHVHYLLEATVNGAAAALEWGAQQWQLHHWQQQLPDWLQTIHDPPVFINTIGGLGSPWWNSGIPAHILDKTITMKTNPAANMVAITESILFLITRNIELMQTIQPIHIACLSGGLAHIDDLCQKLANLSGLETRRLKTRETTACGIAHLCDARTAIAAEYEQIWNSQPDSEIRQRYQIFLDTLQGIH